jgi:hypothetical protein
MECQRTGFEIPSKVSFRRVEANVGTTHEIVVGPDKRCVPAHFPGRVRYWPTATRCPTKAVGVDRGRCRCAVGGHHSLVPGGRSTRDPRWQNRRKVVDPN